MKQACGIVCVMVWAVTAVSLLGADAGLGAADFKPSPEHPVGWRGDGTGCYPKATPPTEWGRVSKALKDLTSQAKKPKGDVPGGTSAADGVLREWLLLGPVPVPEGAKLATDFIPNEAQLQPDENEKTGELTWKPFKAESNCMDFNTIMGKQPKMAAYAHTYIYSKVANTIVLAGTYHNGVRCWLNGKDVFTGEKAWSANATLALTPGWNRLLFKLVPDPAAGDNSPAVQWYFSPQLFGRAPYEYENKNIAWSTRMPGASNASPIVVGDKVFSPAETYDLVCLNKADGKILWVNSANYFDTLTEEELKATPALQEAVPWGKRIVEINKAYSTATPPDGKMIEEKHALEANIHKLMLTVDRKKYKLLDGQDLGYAGITPVSDGKNVYVWYATGITVCYDLNGNRKWIHLDNDAPIREHGVATTPVLIGGKLIIHMNETVALDAATGAVLWRLPREAYQASLTGLTIGKEALFLEPNGTIRRAADGTMLFEQKGQMAIQSPVIKDGVVYFGGGSYALPAKATEPFKADIKPPVPINTLPFPLFYYPVSTASPLINEGLLYSVNIDGLLSVVDLAAGQVLYQKMLDVSVLNHHNMKAARGLGSSPVIAGKYLYVFGNQGSTVVLETGRTYKQVAKNRLENSTGIGQWYEHQETSISSPVFEGDRMYYRSEDTMYCIGAATPQTH